jgi:hypothetical protein
VLLPNGTIVPAAGTVNTSSLLLIGGVILAVMVVASMGKK